MNALPHLYIDAELALMNGNACNGVVLAIACAYQWKVLGRECN